MQAYSEFQHHERKNEEKDRGEKDTTEELPTPNGNDWKKR